MQQQQQQQSQQQQYLSQQRTGMCGNIDLYNQNYQEIQQIGRGSFGYVKQVKHVKEGKYYAAKILKHNQQDYLQQFIEEAEICQSIQKLQIPNISQCYEYYSSNQYEPPCVIIIMEKYEKSLENFLTNNNIQNDQRDKNFNDRLIRQLLLSYYGCLNKAILPVFHRDIKADNVLVDQYLNFFLSDFGEAKYDKNQKMNLHTVRGTCSYMSPELINFYDKNKNDPSYPKLQHSLEKSDVYSLGLIFLQGVLNLDQTSLAGINKDQSLNIIKQMLQRINDKSIQYLLEGMLKYNSQVRFTINRCIEHYFPDISSLLNYFKYTQQQLKQEIDNLNQQLSQQKELFNNQHVFFQNNNEQAQIILKLENNITALIRDKQKLENQNQIKIDKNQEQFDQEKQNFKRQFIEKDLKIKELNDQLQEFIHLKDLQRQSKEHLSDMQKQLQQQINNNQFQNNQEIQRQVLEIQQLKNQIDQQKNTIQQIEAEVQQKNTIQQIEVVEDLLKQNENLEKKISQLQKENDYLNQYTATIKNDFVSKIEHQQQSNDDDQLQKYKEKLRNNESSTRIDLFSESFIKEGGHILGSLVEINNKQFIQKLMNYNMDEKGDLYNIWPKLKEVIVMLSINCLPEQVPLPLSNNNNQCLQKPQSQFEKLKAIAYSHSHMTVQGKSTENLKLAFYYDPYMGSLWDLVKDFQSILNKLQIALSIAQALKVMNDNNIFHNNLKPQNVFIDKNHIAIIGGFGSTKISDDSFDLTFEPYTPDFSPPEMLVDKRIMNRTVDIYSYGCILFWLFTNKRPFVSLKGNQKEDYIASKQETVVKNYLRVSKQSNNNNLGGNVIRQLIDDCTQVDYLSRVINPIQIIQVLEDELKKI